MESFEDIFERECQKSPLVVEDYITDDQINNIKLYGSFLNQIPSEDHLQVAKSLVDILHDYNRRTDGNELMVVSIKESLNRRTRDEKIAQKFLSVLKNKNCHAYKKNVSDLIDDLKTKTEEYLEYLSDEEEVFYTKPTRALKTAFRQKIYGICDTYNLPKGRNVKKLIDNIDYIDYIDIYS